MRRTVTGLATVAIVAVALARLGLAQAPQGRAAAAGAQPAQPSPAARAAATPPAPVFKLEDNFLQWRLAPAEKAYEATAGRPPLQYVNDLAARSRPYRDSGHPQFWGRIIGSSADQEDAQWLMTRM